MADIPDIDLSSLGVTTFGSFTVEVIDPVPDYLELLEVPTYLAFVLQLLVCRSCRMLIVNCYIRTQVFI
jgi:phosphoglucomutase